MREPTAHDGYVRVFSPPETEPSFHEIGEWMWAEVRLDGLFEVGNIPFNVYGVSCGDLVEAHEVDGALTFARVVSRSGNSTYRARFPRDQQEKAMKLRAVLREWGCDIEMGLDHYAHLAINVPNRELVHKVFAHLQSLEQSGELEFEEGHYFDPAAHPGATLLPKC